ncbi:hypothetical protein L1987_45493 [Smallanthus sonchifolius]|uniref:Uncharacterized protein n=1 Tax=Smallanthus sonchifolius TaxID=185202 RepID=A0ACB9FY53_9ASTR|nr:hypothetical protein L1987_45493 [Smallanthus sonchifolius]
MLGTLEKSATLFRPKLIVAGASAYARLYDYARIRKALKMVMEKESWFMMPLETIQTVSFAGLVGDGAALISQTDGPETAPQPSIDRKIDIII